MNGYLHMIIAQVIFWYRKEPFYLVAEHGAYTTANLIYEFQLYHGISKTIVAIFGIGGSSG